jgi:hypothetical protein
MHRVHRQNNEFTDGTGNQFLHLQEATDHKRDNIAVPRSAEGMGHGANGQAKPNKVMGKRMAQTDEQSQRSQQDGGPF